MAEPSMNEAYKTLERKHKMLLRSQSDLHIKIADLERQLNHALATNRGLQRKLAEMRKEAASGGDTGS